MPKNTFQDVTPPDRRTIRNVPINSKRKLVKANIEPEYNLPLQEPPKVQREPTSGYPTRPTSTSNKSPWSKIFIFTALVVVLVFVFFMMDTFTSANITITPKKENVAFNLTVNVSSLTTTTSITASSSLKYEVVELKKEGEKEVAASGEENVERKASGKVILYNNFSGEPQRLIARTRLETPEGLIFRINDSIVIPGKTATAPGSIEVVVYADEAGDKYNVGQKDFTIPGFKSDAPRYKGFYARSKEKITGGFIGKAPKIADADKQTAYKDIEASLKLDLEKEIVSKTPENLVILPGAIIYDFTPLQQEASSPSKALVKEEASAYAIAFDKKALANLLESQLLKSWEDLPVEIASFDKISLSFVDEVWRPYKTNSVSVKLSGSADLVAIVDTAYLKENLKGKSKIELQTLINSSPSIEAARAAVRPLWKNVFPANSAKINIQVEH